MNPKTILNREMASFVGQGEAQALAGSSQNRSVCSTSYMYGSDSEVVIDESIEFNAKIERALSITKLSGAMIIDKIKEDGPIDTMNSLVIKKLPDDAIINYKLRGGEMLENRLWILNGKTSLDMYLDDMKKFRGKGICVLEKYLPPPLRPNDTDDPLEDRAVLYRQLFHRMPFILDKERYSVIVTGINPNRYFSCPQEVLLPVFNKKGGCLRIEDKKECCTVLEQLSIPGVTTTYLRNWLELTKDVNSKPYHLPIDRYICHTDFEVCAGEMSEEDFKKDRAKHIKKNKEKDRSSVPERIKRIRQSRREFLLRKKLQKIPPQVRKTKITGFTEDYETVLEKLNTLSLGAKIAESCGGMSAQDAMLHNWNLACKVLYRKFPMTVVELTERAVAFVEQMGLLFFTCKQAKSFAGIASAIALWLVTRFSGDKSVIMRGFNLLKDFMGSENVEGFVESAKSIPVADLGREEEKENWPPRKPKKESEIELTKVKGEVQAETCNGLDYDELSDAFNSAKFLGHSETMVRLQDFVSIISQIGCCSIFGYTLITENFSGGFSKFMYATRFYDAVVGHVTYFIERLWAVYEEKDMRALLGSDSTGDLMLRVQDLENIVKTINSNTTMLDSVTVDKLEMDIDDNIKRLARAVHSTSGMAKVQFIRSRQKLLDIKVDMTRIRESGANVVPAFGILNFGVTGQGKSSVNDAIISGLLAEHHDCHDECGYQTMQGGDKWDQAQPGFRACVLEELASTNPNKELSPQSIERILRFINPARMPAMSAEAEKKGSLLPKYNIVLAATNVKDFHADKWLSHGAAALRRFKFYITTKADPQYTEKGILSSEKVPIDKAPWLMTLQRYVTVVNESLVVPRANYDHSVQNSAVRGYWEIVKFEGKDMFEVDFNTAYRCISEAYKNHLAKEGDLNIRSTILREMGVCDHGVPFTYCEDASCVRLKAAKMTTGLTQGKTKAKELKKKLEKYDKPFFLRRFAKAQASAGDEPEVKDKRTIFGLFGGKPTPDKILERIRATGLETVSFAHVQLVADHMGIQVTLEQFERARQLQKWHVTNKNEQGDKFFKSDLMVRKSLVDAWKSLKGTIFSGIRAPYRTCDFPRSTYVPSVATYGDLHHVEDEKAYNECKRFFEMSEASTGYLQWKKQNKLLAPIVDMVLVRAGLDIDKDSWLLNSIASAFTEMNDRIHPVIAIPLFIGCFMFIPWASIFVVPLMLMYFVMMCVHHVMEKCNLFWAAFDPSHVKEMVIVRAREYVKNRYVQVGAAVTTGLIAGGIAYSLYYKESKPKSEACGSEVSKPVEIKPGFKDIYQRPVVSTVKEYTKLGPNNTLEQAVSVISNALYVMRMSTPGTKLSDKVGVTFSNCILTGMFAIVNRHSFVGLGDKVEHEQMEIEVFQSRNMQPHCKCFVVRDDIEFFGDDFVLVRLMSIVPSYDLFKENNSLFPEKKFDRPVHCTWLCRGLEGKLEREIVHALPVPVVYEDRRNSQLYQYYGLGFNIPEAKKGQCMAVLISHTNPFMVVGVHTAGHVGYKEAMAGRIVRGDVVEAIKRYNSRQVMPTACVGDIDVDPFSTGSYELRPLTKEACVNYIPKDLGISNCQVYGQIPGLVNQRQTTDKEKFTSIGAKMNALKPEYEVAMPINLHPRGFLQNLTKCAVQTDCGRRNALKWAEDSLFEYYSKNIDILDAKGETNFARDVHPVPEESVFNDGVAGFNTVDLTKSAGYGLRGKKRAYMEEPIEFGEYDSYVLPKPELKRAVNDMFDKCKRGEIPSSIHTGSLKRELLPKDKCTVKKPFEIVYDKKAELEEGQYHIGDILKKKVRFFAGCSFPYLICCKMMFGMLLRYFTLHNVIFGMALGLNLHSYDFTVLVNAWVIFGAAIIAGDYEKFDKKLNAMVTNTSARVIIRLLVKAGYNEELVRICSCLLYDVIYPLYLWGGVILRLAQTTPSGHPLTLFKNNLDNQICIRYCWFRLFEDLGLPVPCFDDFVVINTVGDDHIGTVSPLYPQFNLQTIAKYMLEIGMIYTAADKTELVNVYESFDKIEYLKMRAKWDDELKVYKPLLNKASIYKMITKTLANFAEGSPAMEEHTLEVLKEAFHCMFYYGEEEYNSFVEEVLSCIDESTFKYVLLEIPSYEEEKRMYKIRLQESNTVKLDMNFIVPTEWNV